MALPHMTLEKQFTFLREVMQEDILLPIHEDLAQAFQLVQCELGGHLGQLYRLSKPLDSYAGGAWNRETGDIWVLADEREPAEERRRLRPYSETSFV